MADYGSENTRITSTLVTRAGSSLLLLAGLLVTMIWLVSPQAASADPVTFYVSTTGNDTHDCLSVGTACQTLQAAIDKAITADIILVAQGIYTDALGTVALITKTVTLQGGWNNAFTVRDQTLYPTTLDAQRSGSVIIMRGADGSPVITPTIEGFIVTGGNGTGMEDCPVSPVGGCGGGILGTNAIPEVLNNVISDNIATNSGTGYGGGIFLQGDATGGIISGNDIINNRAAITHTESITGYGGGISLYEITTTVQDNVISDNTAATGEGFGGGIYLFHSGSWIYTNTLRNNIAGIAVTSANNGCGGGVYIWRCGTTYSSIPTIDNNEMHNNIGSDGGRGAGGGVSLLNAEVVIIDNLFDANTAAFNSDQQGDGGAVYGRHGGSWIIRRNQMLNNTSSTDGRGFGGALQLEYANVTVEDNLIRGNTATRATTAVSSRGGGVNLLACTGVMRHNVVRDNVAAVNDIVASYGGGISVVDTPVLIERNTVINNSATRWGGGIRIFRVSPVTVANNIVAGNSATGQGGGMHVYGDSEGSSSVLLIHNTLADNTQGTAGEGVYVNGVSSVTMINNIVVNHTIGIINAGSNPTTTITTDYSLFAGNTADTSGSINSTNEIYGSPAFVNPSNDDYHIQITSAALNAGTNTSVYLDIDSEARPQGFAVDVGADEYFSCGTPITFYRDADGDGYGDATISIIDCSHPTGYVTDNTDCNDNDEDINPGANEVCNGIDDNCDGDIDDNDPSCTGQPTWYRDADGDGYGDLSIYVITCSQPVGYVLDNTDCDDSNEDINPGAIEVCNGIDDDCDGGIDEGIVCTDEGDWYVDWNCSVCGTGTMDSPFEMINQALSVANEGDVIMVAQGVYTENLIINEPLTLTGGYSATLPYWSRDISQYETVVTSADRTVPGDWNGDWLGASSIINDSGMYKMWYSGGNEIEGGTIGYANSPDGTNWYHPLSTPVLDIGPMGAWDQAAVSQPSVMATIGGFRMWFLGIDATGEAAIGHATSSDGLTWQKHLANPILRPDTIDEDSFGFPKVIQEAPNIYKMWYSGEGNIWLATSPDGYTWTKSLSSPALIPGASGSWDDAEVYAPNVIVGVAGYEMWYVGEGAATTEPRIGYATSVDGITWTKSLNNPVMAGTPGPWEYGIITYPAVLKEANYQMWYLGGEGSQLAYGHATSSNGVIWTKYASNPIINKGNPTIWGSSTVGLRTDSGNTVLDGLTITGGYSRYGGGITLSGTAPTIRRCTIRDNIAYLRGGGLEILTGSPLIQNTEVRNNTVMLGWGAGVYVSEASPVISASLVIDNLAIQGGGGMAVWRASSLTVFNTSISQNEGGRGGGIDLDGDSTLSISESSIDNNTAYQTSGINVRSSSLVMTNTFVVDNTTVSGNTGAFGFINATGRLINVTIANNTVSNGTGGIFFYTTNSADDLTVLNSILAFNGTDDVSCSGGTCNITYSNVQEGVSGIGNISAPPRFVNRYNGNFHLSSTSPAIDTGTGVGAPNIDYDGDIRPSDAVDMGADEFTWGSFGDIKAFFPLVINAKHFPANYYIYQPIILNSD